MAFLKKLCSISLLVGVCCLASACQEIANGPRETCLEKMAAALEQKNSANFLAQINMKSYSANELLNLKKENDLLSFADSLGGLLGMRDQVDTLLHKALDLEQQLTTTFTRTVANGELVEQCSRATTSDCPWYPNSLRSAEITKLGEQAAVAKVTNYMTKAVSWLALRKDNNVWVVVGKAASLDKATAFANDTTPLSQQQTPSQTPQPTQPTEKKTPVSL